MPNVLRRLRVPIVQAPLAGGASTPQLAAAVAAAGGLGFLAAGYRSAARLAEDIGALRALSDAPFGLNIFAPPGRLSQAEAARLDDYSRSLRAEAERSGAQLGDARHDDDAFAAKVALAAERGVAVVSFTFGLPPAEAVRLLNAAGSEVWITVTTPEEAQQAAQAGADALVVQGAEAGGHRGGLNDEAEALSLLPLLRLTAARTPLPLVAAGGIADGAAVAAVLCAGAAAAQIGTALMLAPEAGTSQAHRAALANGGRTALTRAFTGRYARGIENRFMREHGADAPAAYPDVHHLTAPLRAAAREAGDAQALNLWAGQAHPLARALPAGEIVRALAAEARQAAAATAARLA